MKPLLRAIAAALLAARALAAPHLIIDVDAREMSREKIDLLVLDGDAFKTITLQYAEGPKYLELVRISDRTDVLGAIGKPTVKKDAP